MADQRETPGPSGLPERRSRTGSAVGGGAPRIDGPAAGLDIDRLRASAASAITAEQAHRVRAEQAVGQEPSRAMPAWLKIALPIGVVVALGTAGLAMAGGDDTVTTAATDRSTTTTDQRPDATSAVPSSDVPTTPAPETVPATAAPTTAAETVPPTTAPPAPEAPPHKAVYRGGKLYLEGSITSQEEAQKYIDKAAAVLGADNVVNNYTVDPSVPLSTDGTVYVDEPFLFETGSAELNPQYTGVLGLGVAALKLNPNARMVVTGYTDNKGDPARNQELSVERANSVVDYMVTTGGIDRSRFDAIGAGDRDPVGDNNTEEGRKQNRRIDVKLVNLLG